ncbi:E3 ubiquitin-protein ligase sina [Anabrus simplex]|uniref:E3 ubiquitin-protein ligase sina n=1 Tax=Anabrus simplex TaxID=316456 RepID=UPI0034DCCDBD
MASTVSEGLNESLTSLLECPVCSEYMSAPISLCINGHNICALCKNKVEVCPTCRGAFIQARNLFAEHVAEKLLFSCKNADYGCCEKLSGKCLDEHASVCPYRLYQCEPGLKTGCTWEGRRNEIYAHVKKMHELRARMKEDNNIFIDNFDLSEELSAAQLIVAHGEIFWYRVKRDPSVRKFFIAVQYIGPQNNASNYKYTLKFNGRNGVSRLVFSNYTLTDTLNISDIYQSGNCLSVDYGFIQNFLTCADTIEFKLKVEKVVQL